MGGKKIISFYLFMENLHPQKGKKKKVCCNRLEDYRVWAERGCKPLFLKKKNKKKPNMLLYLPTLCKGFTQTSPDLPLLGCPTSAPGSSPSATSHGGTRAGLLLSPTAVSINKDSVTRPPPHSSLPGFDWEQWKQMAPAAINLTNEEKDSGGSRWARAHHWIGSGKKNGGGGVWGELQYRWFFI